jgi:hypothetical protein
VITTSCDIASIARSHVADLLVQPAERVERARLVGVEAEHVGVGLDRAIEVLQLALVDHAHRAVQIDAGRDVGRVEDVVAVGLDQRLPAAGLVVQARQLAVRAVVATVEGDDLLQRLGGAIELAEPLLPGRGHALVQRHPLGVGGRRVELGLEHLEVLLGLVALLVQLLERAQRRQVRRVGLEHRLVAAIAWPASCRRRS